MKFRALVLCISFLAAGMTVSADTLHLTSGQTIYGTFNGRTPQGIQFTGTDGRTQIYPYQEVDNLNFGPIPAPPQPVPLWPVHSRFPESGQPASGVASLHFWESGTHGPRPDASFGINGPSRDSYLRSVTMSGVT